MTVHVTGDTHGVQGVYERFSDASYAMGNVSEGDTIIILGDFGVVWEPTPSPAEEACLDWLAAQPFTFAFIDGNHENHDRLDAMSVSRLACGEVHELRPNVWHLLRGRAYELDERHVLCLGGAHSPDKYYRTPHLTWWEQEIPSQEDRQRALDALSALDWNPDAVLTHTPPWRELKRLCERNGFGPVFHDELSVWLDQEIASKARFGRWLYGHMHVDDWQGRRKYAALYRDIVPL